MNWLKRAQEALRSIVLGPYNAKDPALARLFGSGSTFSGIGVNEYTALNVGAVWCAVVVLSGGVSTLPLDLMKRVGKRSDKERFIDHPTYELVHDRPNPEMSSVVFRRTLQAHALTWGNGYAEIERDEGARPIALWPLTPDRVAPHREPVTRALRYRVTHDSGTGYDDLEPQDILHIPGLGWDGICGYSVVSRMRETLGLSTAMERFGAQLFGNGANASGVLSHPKTLSDPARKHLEESLVEHHSQGRARRAMVLEEGMTWTQMSIPPDDGQFLESRKFEINEFARWFNVPPHKLKDLERATFSNIEQQSIDFVTESLMPWLICWEQELQRKLIRPLERRQQFFKHNVMGLLRGDTASRFSAYAVGRQWGWLSANDVRDLEDMNSIGAQGDIYLMPGNMLDADGPMPTPGAPSAPPPPAASAADAAAVARHAELQGQLAAIATELLALRALVPSGPAPDSSEPLAALQGTLDDLLGRVEALSARHVQAAATASDVTVTLGELRQGVDAARAAVAALPGPDVALRADMAAALGEAEGIRDAVGAIGVDLSAVREAMASVPVAPEPGPPAMTAEQAAEMLERMATLTDLVLRAVAPPPLPAPADPEPAPETFGLPTQARDLARMITGHRAAIEDAVGRLVRREALKARRAATAPTKLRAWVADFYPRQGPVFEAILLPAIQAHMGMLSSARDPVDVTRELVAAHIEVSRAQLHALLDTAPADLDAAVGALLDRWLRERPGARADALMEEELTHAR